jgi:tetratricopeptide (TPR) repeat protein
MPAQDNPKPGPTEIRQQLARILQSEHFRHRVRPGELLTLLVEKHIEGKTLDEEEIRAALYAGLYDPDGTNVRTAVSIVRGLIGKYHKGEGLHDPVTISLPKKFSKEAPRKGQPKPYPVVCEYNPKRQDLALFRLARQAMERGTPAKVRKALETFETILRNHPEHLEAKIARLECLCLTVLYIPDARTRREIIDDAVESGRNLVEDNPTNWRARLLFATALACRRSWDVAICELAEAIRIDHDHEMRQSLWFPAMCLLTGKGENARDIAYGIATGRIDDRNAWAAYGFFLYFNREFEAAEKIFLMAIGLDDHSWLSHLGLVFVCLATGRPDSALDCYKRADRMVGEAEAFMPSLAMLAASRVTGNRAALSEYLLEEIKKLLHPADAQKDWLQIAIGNIDRDPAPINALRMAWQLFHPLAMLVPWWPIFDPFRENPDFVQLIQQIRVYPGGTGPSSPPI